MLAFLTSLNRPTDYSAFEETMEEFMIMSDMMSLFSSFIQIVVCVFLCVVMWKIFAKAGEEGWKYLIPFYGRYIECKIVGKKWIFVTELLMLPIAIISFIVSIVGFVMGLATMFESGSSDASFAIAFIGLIIFVILCIAEDVLKIIHLHNLSKAFGQGIGFTIGLIFLPIIFKAVIAFSPNIHYVYGNYNQNINNYNENDPNIGSGSISGSYDETRLNQESNWNNSELN